MGYRYRNNLILTNLFASFTIGAYFTRFQHRKSSVQPEIRSSNTPIVQVAQPAAVRLQQQIEQDGGSIEVPVVEQEKNTPGVSEENTDIPEPADISSDLDLPQDLPTDTDEVDTSDNANENVPEEPVVEEERSEAPSEEPTGSPTTPLAEGQSVEKESWWSRNVSDPARKVWNGFTGLLGFGQDDKKVEKPAGLSQEEQPVVRTISPNGAKEQTPATPDMTKLTDFLKSKGLSDADIQTAVALARGQEPPASLMK